MVLYQYSRIILLCCSQRWGLFCSSNIEIDYFNVISFICLMLITTYSHLNIISCGGWQLLQEPWRIIEHTASAVCPATSSIPQGVIGIKRGGRGCLCAPSVAEVVVSDVAGGWGGREGSSCRLVYIGARTICVGKHTHLIPSRCKCPDVLAWAATVSETHSVDVGGVDRLYSPEAIDIECISESLLVSNDPPTDMAVGHTLDAECGG